MQVKLYFNSWLNTKLPKQQVLKEPWEGPCVTVSPHYSQLLHVTRPVALCYSFNGLALLSCPTLLTQWPHFTHSVDLSYCCPALLTQLSCVIVALHYSFSCPVLLTQWPRATHSVALVTVAPHYSLSGPVLPTQLPCITHLVAPHYSVALCYSSVTHVTVAPHYSLSSPCYSLNCPITPLPTLLSCPVLLT